MQGEQGATGPEGPQGPAGVKGADGRSAYQSAAEAGYAGTESAFNEALSQVPSHIGNTTAHITAEERSAWNAKADGKDLDTHTGNSNIHVTASEKTGWNGKAAGAVSVTFGTADWSGSGGSVTLTIPQTTHKRESADFTFAVYSLCSDGGYAQNTWNVLELDTEYTASTGAFKLCSATAFAGKIVFLG